MDLIRLREWGPREEDYTGNWVLIQVGHVTTHTPPSPLPENVICFDIHVVQSKIGNEVRP